MSLLTLDSTAITLKVPWAYLVAQELLRNFAFLEHTCSGYQMFLQMKETCGAWVRWGRRW